MHRVRTFDIRIRTWLQAYDIKFLPEQLPQSRSKQHLRTEELSDISASTLLKRLQLELEVAIEWHISARIYVLSINDELPEVCLTSFRNEWLITSAQTRAQYCRCKSYPHSYSLWHFSGASLDSSHLESDDSWKLLSNLVYSLVLVAWANRVWQLNSSRTFGSKAMILLLRTLIARSSMSMGGKSFSRCTPLETNPARI